MNVEDEQNRTKQMKWQMDVKYRIVEYYRMWMKKTEEKEMKNTREQNE